MLSGTVYGIDSLTDLAIVKAWKSTFPDDVAAYSASGSDLRDQLDKALWNGALGAWVPDYDDPLAFLAGFASGSPVGNTGWSDARYDRLIHDAGLEVNPEKRFAMLAEAERIVLADGPVIPIYHYSTNELVKPYVRGIYQTPLDIHPLTYVWIDRDWEKRPAEVALQNGDRRAW